MIEIVIADPKEVRNFEDSVRHMSHIWFPAYVQWTRDINGRLHVKINPMGVEDLKPRKVEAEVD